MYSLFIATALSFCSVHANYLGKPVSTFCLPPKNPNFYSSKILKWMNVPSEKEYDLLFRKRQLQSQQSTINMVDSFAKYSRVQRQINSINEELSQLQGERSSAQFKYNLFFTYGLRVAVGLLLFVLSVYYRHEPVFSVPRKFDLTPFTKIISYPNKDNDVSFHFWVICCTTVARLIPGTRN